LVSAVVDELSSIAPLIVSAMLVAQGAARPGRVRSTTIDRVASTANLGYSYGMQLPVELSDAQLESLRDRAKSLGISPEQLASAAVADLVERPAEDFSRAASQVLSQNAELYRRLAW